MCYFWSTLKCNYPLIKHSGMWKCIIAKLGVAIGKYSIYPTNSHVKTKFFFIARGLDIIASQLENGAKAEKKKNTSNLWQFGIFSIKAIPWQILNLIEGAFQVFEGGELLPQTLVRFH